MNKKLGELRSQVCLRPGGKLSRVVARSEFEQEPFQKVSGRFKWRIQKRELQCENLSDCGEYVFTETVARQTLTVRSSDIARESNKRRDYHLFRYHNKNVILL